MSLSSHWTTGTVGPFNRAQPSHETLQSAPFYLPFSIRPHPFRHESPGPLVLSSFISFLFFLLHLSTWRFSGLDCCPTAVLDLFAESRRPNNSETDQDDCKLPNRLNETPRPDHSRFSDTPGNTYRRSLTQLESVRLKFPRGQRYVACLLFQSARQHGRPQHDI
ncbi:hypothetical protein B0T20DRAFT_213775 [Sordaria brevicollis]|uniref:Uncharacterized protein n=1 Tax=Sordaria brevicollis TaxID=83679 RepID=A0AAE0PER5_SORBR|nr:hypothetical protein B0T20DRAFT_213775 [Sordaria brevicollis]